MEWHDHTPVQELEGAEKALAAAEEEQDSELAKGVEELINALPSPEKINTEDKTAIEAARAAYDALTADQKALVTPEDLAKLTAAEAALAAAEQATGVENVQGNVKNAKILENGQIYILRGDKTYSVTGQKVK